MRALCICEKPSLMREVKGVYDKINFKDKVDFVALHGHCLSLAEPGDYKKEWETWDKNVLPMIPDNFKYKVVDKDVIKEVKELLKKNKYDYLINSTDAEREGQNIFYSLYTYLGLKQPVKRIWLSDLNFEPIKKAWENLRDDLNDDFLKNLTASSKCRAYSDWLVGMNLTRACGKRVGRVKTPTLELLAKRELAIKNFKEVITYDVESSYKDGFTGLYSPDKNEESGGAFTTKNDANNFIKTLGDKGEVLDYSEKEVKENAPLLFSLGELQAEANKTFGFTLKETLDLAQGLYEAKITTYPRTDCSYIPSGDAARLPKIIKDVISYIPDVTKHLRLIDNDVLKNYKNTKYVNDSKVKAHGAIIFTGKSFDFSKLSVNQKKIVTLIAKRIVATLMPPIVSKKTKLIVDINGNNFISNGSKNIDKGFAVLYDKKFDDVIIPKYKKGDIIKIDKYNIVERISKCPPRYNDSSLIKAMINIGNTLEDKELANYLKGESADQGGIGTPATRAAIVESLLEPVKVFKNLEYWVERKGKSFIVTEAGLKVAQALENTSVASAELTARWEEKLNQIEDGKLTMTKYMKEMETYIKEETDNFKNISTTLGGVKKMGQIKTLEINCPACGKPIKETDKYFMCEGYTNDSCKFIIGKDFNSAKIDEEILKDICEGKETAPINFYSQKKSKNFSASLKYDKEEGRVKMIFNNSVSNGDETAIKCDCGGKVFKKSGQYGDYYECPDCKKRMSKKYAGHSFTIDELKKLFNGQKLSDVKFKSKAGKDFSATVKYDNNEKKLEMEFE